MSDQTPQLPEQPSRVTREQLRDLHSILTETLLLYMTTTPPEKRRAGMLEVIRAFLKDNGVTKNIESARDVSSTLESINDIELPFMPDYLTSDNLN